MSPSASDTVLQMKLPQYWSFGVFLFPQQLVVHDIPLDTHTIKSAWLLSNAHCLTVKCDADTTPFCVNKSSGKFSSPRRYLCDTKIKLVSPQRSRILLIVFFTMRSFNSDCPLPAKVSISTVRL